MGLLDWLFSFSYLYRWLRGGFWELWLAPNHQNTWWFHNQHYRLRGQRPEGYARCVEYNDFRRFPQ